MTTPPSHRPRRGRVFAAAAAAVLTVAGLVLLVTASGQPGESVPSVAGAPSSASTPSSPGSPPSPGAVAVGSPDPRSSDAGASGDPAAPVPARGPGAGVTAPANGAGPGQPGSPSGTGTVVPGQPGNTSGAATGGPAGSPGNPGNAAAGGTGGGSGVSDAARRSALGGAPAVMPPGTIALPSLGVGPVGTGEVCPEPNGILEPSSQGPMTCAWRGSAALDATSGMTTEAGHVNFNGRQGAFSRLSQLLPGDAVYTASSSGRVTAWVVTREYARSKTLPLDVSAFRGPDGPRQLALVSCGGKLTGRSYDDNIFAFAVPV